MEVGDARGTTVTIVTYSDASVDEIFAFSLDATHQYLDEQIDEGPLSRYGSFTGQGRVVHGVIEGLDSTETISVTSGGTNRVVVVTESCVTEDVTFVRPGFKLVEQTLETR